MGSSVGCNDIGFVTLMKINEFCNENQIIFNDTGLDSSRNFLKYHEYKKSDGCCKCANYLYCCSSTNKLIDIYGRFVMDASTKDGLISFDGEHLREGFNGLVIPLE